MGDIDDFIAYGQSFLNGHYFARYPLPMQGFFAILALLPRPVVYVLIIGLSILILVYLFKRQVFLWIGFMPILECLAAGNLDILALWLIKRASPVSLALLTLKPQLFIVALPILLKQRKLWKPFIFWCSILWGLPTLLYPGWIMEFVTGASDGRVEHGTSSSLWPVPLLAISLIVYLLSARQFNWAVITSALNPLWRAYDYTLLAGSSLWLIPISWVSVGLMWLFAAAWPMALVGVALLLPHDWYSRLKLPQFNLINKPKLI